MADALSLLFELDADGRPAVAEFQRVKKAFATEIAALRKSVAQSFTLPPIKLPTTATAGGRGQQVDDHVKEFRRIEAEAAKSTKAQEREQQRLNAAVESLQRQRTAALIRAFKEEERAAVASAKAQERAVAASVKAQERAALAAAKAQEQAARQAAARVTRQPQSDQQVRDFRRIEAERQKAQKASETAAARSARVQEREQARLNRAVQSLQRQRSAAIIASFKAEERAAIASARAQERAAQQASRSIANAFRGIGPGLQSLGRTLTVGITAPLAALGAISLKSAKDLDANVNTLKAFTGSAEAAERRLAQLIKTARDTPGLTTNLALTLDAYLRTAKATEESIDKVLPAIGRLNAVSKLPDSQRFAQNLVQLVTQNFEKPDLKELVGQSPLAGQLITEIFNVDSPVNSEAIRASAKKLGLTTVDAFFTAFAEAAQRNQGLATVTESIGTRFEKVVDRVTVALRPLGLAILNAIEPFVEPVARLIERVAGSFDALPSSLKTLTVVAGGIAAATGPMLFILGGLATGITAVVTAIGTIAGVVASIGLPVIAAAIAAIVIVIGRAVAILAVLGLAWKTNFLNIRGLVADAAGAVLQAFNRIRAVFDEATRRILPTLQSITTKVLAAITAVWDRYGEVVVRVVGDAFEFIIDVTETFLRTFTNFVDLVLKLIDGDWRGAWGAFSRIVITVVDGIVPRFVRFTVDLKNALLTLTAFIIRQAVVFAQAALRLASDFITSLVVGLIAGAPLVSDALAKMLILAVAAVAVGPIGASLMARLLEAMRKAASEAPPIPIKVEAQNVGADVGFTGGIARRKRPPSAAEEDENKGADAAARRRIRLLEIQADKVRTLTDAQLAREQIAFDERKKSLEDYTNAQIVAAHQVLTAQLAIYAKERDEANKIRNKSARDLAVAEIGQREFEAQQTFTTKVAQLEATRRKEELEAAKAHRQALLDIQEQADDAELARLEDLQRQGHVTAFDVANRQAEIEKAARARRRAELELQLREADQNAEERGKILDEIKQVDDESAESVRRNERLKREAVQETADAYRDYKLTLLDALEATAEATRNAAAIAITRLSARVLRSPRERIERQFELDKKALDAQKRAADLRINEDERAAVEQAKKAGELGEKLLEIEKTFNDRRLAEQKRFEQEKGKLEEDKQADLERADPSSARSLFGDLFADTASATGSTLAGLAATANSIFADISAQAGNFGTILTGVFSQVADAVGNVVKNFVLFGSAGTSFKKFAVEVIASIAQMSIIKSVFEFAEAAAMFALGWFTGSPNFFKSAKDHLLAGAIYASVGALAAGVGRSIAGRSSASSGGGVAGAAVNGGQTDPQNREFQSGTSAETSSSASREGSGGPRGILGTLAARIEAFQQQNLELQRQQQLQNAQVAETLTRMRSARPGDVVTMGAADARQAIGAAVIDHSNADGEFNERLQRNLGFA